MLTPHFFALHRHPYPPINVDYRYRFHAPQHETYEISGVNFTTEKLENFNWNHMDLYICTRGDVDYPLMEVSMLIHKPSFTSSSCLCRASSTGAFACICCQRIPWSIRSSTAALSVATSLLMRFWTIPVIKSRTLCDSSRMSAN